MSELSLAMKPIFEQEPQEQKRCTGHCCEHFTFPYSIAEMQRMHDAIVKDEKHFIRDNGLKAYTRSNLAEVTAIRDMLILIEVTDINPKNGKVFYSRIDINSEEWKRGTEYIKQDPDAHFIVEDNAIKARVYTCKHFDTVSRNCTIYETRPQMCRNYPSHDMCDYVGCTSSCAVKEIKDTLDNYEDKN